MTKRIFVFLIAVFIAGCVEEYSDTIVLHKNGSADLSATIFPYPENKEYIDAIKLEYKDTEGLEVKSVTFLKRDSLTALSINLAFENLFEWKGSSEVEETFGIISLKRIDSIPQAFSFKRLLNPSTENSEEAVVPEEQTSFGNMGDSSFIMGKYSLVLPENSQLLATEPFPSSIERTGNTITINWDIPLDDIVSKKQLLQVDFVMPEKTMHSLYFIAIFAVCIVMFVTILLLILRLKRLNGTLTELLDKEKYNA